MKKRLISIILCIATCMSIVTLFASCSKGDKALVIMTEELDGVFNPFYSTTASDATIVAMTQIGMLTTAYTNGEVKVAYGDNEAVVVKDFEQKYDAAANKTVYTFVIKNGIKFSDGKPLTMNDVLFNLYVYLDPVYTGSSTMYSTDIVGLQSYRTQKESSAENEDELLTDLANRRANDRIWELINLYRQIGTTPTQGKYEATYDEMVAAIKAHNLNPGYKEAVSNNPSSVTYEQLLADYERALKLFKEELETDYASAKEAYTEDPYKSTGEFDEVTSFMYMEQLVEIKYAEGSDGKIDKSRIERVNRLYNTDVVKDKESAINYVYNTKIEQNLDQILQYWATAQTLRTEFAAKAKEVILREGMQDGELAYPNISGIQSLGHTTGETAVTVNGTNYTVAHEHNTDGTVKNADQYDVLRITINGVDPKAVWNFAFSVAPQHYYAEGYTVDIANNKFGVEYASFDFMTDVIQSTRNLKVPMGAGAYMATNRENESNPDGNAFFKDNVVYFKRNDSFLLGQPKIEKIRYQVTSASNALYALETGAVHYVTPQFTPDNIAKLDSLQSKGFKNVSTDQLGYGYIGINAGKVKDINLRKAIMAAMNTSLALNYYTTGTAENIYWPMSTVSWAYPKDGNGDPLKINGKDYPSVNFDRNAAKEKILELMGTAGVSEGDEALSITFTIAGANLTDHPTYTTFQQAAALLNECGWDIEVVADTQALTKLSTGSLSVWAAAWGSTIDPDMYQVYHKNSTATSVLAWGYREILANTSYYSEEYAILGELSELIDEARTTEDQTVRAGLYKQAMGKVLDLAVELPVYQRSVLYAYNSKVIKESSLPTEINPYTSPLDRIWEIEFAD